MNDSNRELLAQVVDKRLREVLKTNVGTDDEKLAFKEAMEAIDREISLRKLDDSYYDESEKRCLEKEKLSASKDEKNALVAFEKEKFNFSKEEQIARREMDINKQTNDEEFRKKESKRNFWIRVGEIAAIAVLAPGIQYVSKKAFAKVICNFEKDYTFTTSAGRSLGSFFRFKD